VRERAKPRRNNKFRGHSRRSPRGWADVDDRRPLLADRKPPLHPLDATPYCAPFPPPPLPLFDSPQPITVPNPPPRVMQHPDVDEPDTMRQRSRTRFGLFPRRKLVPETRTLTPTCPVTSRSLFSPTGYPTPPFDPWCSNYDRNVLRDTFSHGTPTAWGRRRRIGGVGVASETRMIRAKEPEAERRALLSPRGTTGMVGILDGDIWKNETTRPETGRGSSSWIVHQSESQAVGRFRAEIRSRRPLRYSGADFVMEKSCYSILINNGGRARYDGENFKR